MKESIKDYLKEMETREEKVTTVAAENNVEEIFQSEIQAKE